MLIYPIYQMRRCLSRLHGTRSQGSVRTENTEACPTPWNADSCSSLAMRLLVAVLARRQDGRGKPVVVGTDAGVCPTTATACPDPTALAASLFRFSREHLTSFARRRRRQIGEVNSPGEGRHLIEYSFKIWYV